ncbi:ABC transporter substrate-binding protein [Rhodoplanes roseus]|uniref:4,5-dihydroxyphthalate decarboxylase n=1 Tax=Rhodoplanes roseus TaxID=29409 RepID=A0A327LAS3_9BRAD|nr:ABC transporter substrate-binding protein [Rhodoplanes roseus]RAI44828.1 4,5-dihydroxyphthalate decarboxylase [Rhodoplanes roseus]
MSAAPLSITLACGNYDRTRAILDGRVRIEGCETRYIPLEPEEVFFRAARYQEFDVSELSLSSYLLQMSRGESAYVGIPAFVSRCFRHSALYVRTDRGIRTPEDLKGKLVGLPEYQMTAMVWLRGILEEDYGVRPSDIHWRSGGQEQPGREERARLDLPAGIDLQRIPPGETLSAMLRDGRLDAVMTARAPSCFLDSAPNIDRLFPNHREVEKEYYRRTGLFPIMHLIGVRRALVEQYPWLPASVYKAFVQAKALAMADLRALAAPILILPWTEAETLDTMALMGRDFWRYGVAENVREIETLARYSHAQGIAGRIVPVSELFAPSTVQTSRI